MKNWGDFDSWIGGRLPLWIGGTPPRTKSTGQFNIFTGANPFPDAYVEYDAAEAEPTPPFVYEDCLVEDADYAVWIKNHSGQRVAVIPLTDRTARLEYSRQLNAIGYYELPLVADDPRIEYFIPDAQVEIWRRTPGGDWLLDWEGFHRRRRWWMDESDRDMFSSIGRAYEELLSRRVTVPPEGPYIYQTSDDEPYDEYGPDELTDIMRDLAYSHLGAGASLDRQAPGFAVEADDHTGPVMSKKWRYINVLTAMQDLSDSGADFAIIGTGPATYEFRAYYPRRGADKTVTNTDGNDPVIFSVDRANMAYPEVVEDWLNVRNLIYVGGGGSGASRTIVEREDAVSTAETPWSRREAFYDRRQFTATARLQDEGDAFLARYTRTIQFQFDYLKNCNAMYREHWDLGDLVTARYRDYQFAVRIIEVHVSVTRAGGEIITPRFKLLWTDS